MVTATDADMSNIIQCINKTKERITAERYIMSHRFSSEKDNSLKPYKHPKESTYMNGRNGVKQELQDLPTDQMRYKRFHLGCICHCHQMGWTHLDIKLQLRQEVYFQCFLH